MISFSSITDRPKTVYDTIDDWYVTNSIIEDPPKSIHTRRIIKVGDNNDLLDAEDTSVDRVSDSILQFSKGVNPMVAVQYNNNNGQEAFLPYRIIKDGAFRPPLDFQSNKYPLSRLPRANTSFQNYGENVDFSKRTIPSEDAVKYKEVQNSLTITPLFTPIQHCINLKVQEPYDIHTNVKNIKSIPIQGTKFLNKQTGTSTDFSTNYHTKDITQHYSKTNSAYVKGSDYINTKIPLTRVPLRYSASTTKKSYLKEQQTRNENYQEASKSTPVVSYQTTKHTNYEPSIQNVTASLRPTRETYSFDRGGNAIILLGPTGPASRAPWKDSEAVRPTPRVSS